MYWPERMRRIALLLALSLIVAACGGEAADDDPAPDDDQDEIPSQSDDDDGEDADSDEVSGNGDGEALTLALAAEIPSLDPQLRDSGQVAQIVYDNVYESLVGWGDGEEAGLEPVLATEWTRVDDLTVEFTLREDVQFHNGEPFNADAAVSSFERMMDEEFASEIAGVATPTIDSVEAVDEYTVSVTTTEPDPVLLNRLTWVMMVPPDHAANADLNEEPVGTGPYTVTGREVDTVNLAANEDYWGETGQVQEVEFRAIQEDSSRMSALEAGEIDIVWDVPVDAIGRVPKVINTAGLEVAAVRPNATRAPADSHEFREAIALATDTGGIRDALWGEYATPSDGHMIPPGLPGRTDELDEYPYDPDRAAEIIEELGLVGETVEFVVPAGRYPRGEDTAEALAANISATGLDVDFQVLPYEEWLDIMLEHNDDNPHLIYTSAGSVTLRDAAEPFTGYYADPARTSQPPHDDCPEMGATFDEAQQEMDPEEREQLLIETQTIGHECYAMWPQYVYDFIWGAQENIEFIPRADGRISLTTVTKG